MLQNDVLTFTVVSPVDEQETPVTIDCKPEVIIVGGQAFAPEQLAEFGMLLFTLACRADPIGIDLDSCYELLHGFDLQLPRQHLEELLVDGED